MNEQLTLARRLPEPAAPVKRPWLVAVLAIGALASLGAAIYGLTGLSAAIAERPQTIVQGAEYLGEALEAAPWTELGEGGPVIWALAPARCRECRAFFTHDLPSLERLGVRVRLIVAAPRDENDAGVLAWTAQAAQARGAGQLAPLLGGQSLPPAPRADPAEVEGYLEWGRATHDRLAGIVELNGLDMETPTLFWQRGEEWRADIGRDPFAAAHVRRELARN